MKTAIDVAVRRIRKDDAAAIAAIDAARGGPAERAWWDDTVARHARTGAAGADRVGLVAVDKPGGRVVGFLLAQVRAFEFGSEPCGWIYAVGVHPDRARGGTATRLFHEARRLLKERGVALVRTMVRRDDVPTLTFFRHCGFAAGPYVEMERPTAEDAQ